MITVQNRITLKVSATSNEFTSKSRSRATRTDYWLRSHTDMTEEQEGDILRLDPSHLIAHSLSWSLVPAQMTSALSAVQAVLGHSTPITDNEIRDALWDSYFDVDGSVTYLLGTTHMRACMTTSLFLFFWLTCRTRPAEEQHKKQAAQAKAQGKNKESRLRFISRLVLWPVSIRSINRSRICSSCPASFDPYLSPNSTRRLVGCIANATASAKLLCFALASRA